MPVLDKKPRGATRLTAAVPGAMTAVLLVGAVAFGSTALQDLAPAGSNHDPAATPEIELAKPVFGASVAEERKHQVAHDPAPQAPAKTEKPKQEEDKPKPSEKAKESPVEQPKEAEQPVATEKPHTEPAKPKPQPTEKPKPAPAEPSVLVLDGWAKHEYAKLAWKPYGGDGFEYYKVVRSADATVTWPASGDDAVVGVIGDANAPWWADKPACGKAWHYRVFAVRWSESGYVTLAASNVVKVSVPCPPEPTPVEVAALNLTVEVVPGEGIALSWDGSTSEKFVYYKVVRSKTNPDPRYPLNSGTELVAAIGDPGQTTLLDTKVAPGETWTYRVLAFADFGSGKVLVGETPAVAATAE